MEDRLPAQKASPSASTALASIALILAAVALAYGSVLDNYFYEIDDAQLLYSVQHGLPTGAHFRPLHPIWNTALYRVFGLEPFGYHLTSVVVHALASCACFALAWRLSKSAIAALGAGLAFACFFSPCESVLWICADGGLLAVACVLASSLAWHFALTSGRIVWHVVALLGAVAAMGFKEDAVVLLPFWVGFDLAVNGWRGFARPGTARRYAPIAALAVVYLALTFRPALWSERPDVGEYEFRLALVPKLFENFALLFWPGFASTAAHPFAPWAGAALALSLAVAAFVWTQQRALLGIGLATALFGLLPTLPGPFAVAGTRYAYASAIGAALIVGGIADRFWPESSSRLSALRKLAVAGALALLVTTHALAVRSIERWRYEARSVRFERLLETTRTEVLEPLAAASTIEERVALVVDPNVWSAQDYFCGVAAILGHPARALDLEWVPLDELLAGTQPGGAWDPAARALFTPSADGAIARVANPALAPLERWRAAALHSGIHAHPGRVPVLRIAPAR